MLPESVEARAQELDRLRELASIGAGRAAAAFARLTGRKIWMEVPSVHTGAGGSFGSEEGAREREIGEEWTTGVFFEFEGALNALVGILFRASATEAVVRTVVGEETGPLPEHYVESALMEVGNILASHVATAIAETVGVTLLPSIPTLAIGHADATLAQLAAGRGGPQAIRIDCELHDERGELGGLLVLVPLAPI